MIPNTNLSCFFPRPGGTQPSDHSELPFWYEMAPLGATLAALRCIPGGRLMFGTADGL